MKLTTVLAPALAALTVSAAPTPTTGSPPNYPTDGPLPSTLPDVAVSRVISIDRDIYPIGVSNGTHYYLYLLDAKFLTSGPSSSSAVEKRSPGWTWWQPYPGEPAWKKTKRDAVAAPEADAAPRWTWWQPYPGEPAWKKIKRDAVAAPDADAAPRWTWWQPYPGEPAWKKTKRDASAAPGWT